MNLFTRRRKESSQQQPPSTPTSTTTKKGISILSASLPSSYRQQKDSTKDAALPPVPALSPDKENAAPSASIALTPRAQHASTLPVSHHAHDSSTNNARLLQINEMGQMHYGNPSGSSAAAPPAFMVNSGGAGQQHHPASPTMSMSNGKHSLPLIPRDSSSKRDLNMKALPIPKIANRRMSTGSIPSIDAMMAHNNTETAELQLCYGYWPIETQLELNLGQVEEIIRLCGHEIRTRGIEAPMLFSTQALDITMEGICSLIRSYISNRDIWRRDLQFASPHDLSGMIKWALGRYVNPRGGRGFLQWETFERWRLGEHEKEYPPRYITTHLLYLLPTQDAELITSLFSLLSNALSYTTKNGCTVRKLSTLFSSYIFGLPDDGTFEQTYTAFNRFSHATEHLLLAFMRDQIYQLEAGGSGAVAPIPVRMRETVQDYPQCLATNLNKPPHGADLQPVVRIRRFVRWYSKNLIASAGTWEVPRSKAWQAIAPVTIGITEDGVKPAPFTYTSKFKHMLNIGSMADMEDEEEMQKYSSMVEKEWKSFMQSGFTPPDASKLKFDLTESDRANRRRKHETIDWTTFENSGFQGREMFLEVDLNFNPGANDPLNKDDLLSEARAKLMAERARNIEKSLPPFNYDITPREERSIQVDKQFLEVFSDVLCSSGWAREEVKESSWALIQLKTRPRAQDRPLSAGSDGRTDETWFLCEEIVPGDYRASLLQQNQVKPKTSRRISFLRPVRKKQSKQPLPALPDISSPLSFFNRSSETVNRNKATLAAPRPSTPRSTSPSLKVPDDSVFASGPTRVIKLSKSISSADISRASSLLQEELEDIHDAPVIIEPADARTRTDSHPVAPSYVKPNGQGAGQAFLDMVRKTTRRGQPRRRSFLGPVEMGHTATSSDSVPDSPASTTVPASPGFNLVEHGVNGPGQRLDHPNAWMERMERMSNPHPESSPQRYERAPASFAGTAHSIETRVTSGHSDSSKGTVNEDGDTITHKGRDHARTDSDSRDSSSSIYDRDLPPQPLEQGQERPFSSATRDAEELVEAYTHDREPSIAHDSSTEENPYDGIADEEETVHSHGHVEPETPQLRPANPPRLYIAPKSPPPVFTPDDDGSFTPRQRGLRSVSQSSESQDKNMSKPLPSPHEVRERIRSPVVPVNGTGRVGHLAGRFGGASIRPTQISS